VSFKNLRHILHKKGTLFGVFQLKNFARKINAFGLKKTFESGWVFKAAEIH
jgi:hypothetical protein